MRVVAFVNNWLGWQALAWLRDGPDDVVGLVVHPPEQAVHREEILACAGLPPARVLDGSTLRRDAPVAAIRDMKPDIGVSVLFGHILKPEVLALFPAGVVNLHPSYLPYNRGTYPNVWSIVDGTPAGVTLHEVDEGVDTGDIIAQREVPVEPSDTGATLYRKLERAGLDLFTETWPSIREGRAPRTPQPAGGSTHRRRDVEALDRIDLDRAYTGRELIDLLRARTFPPHRGAYFEAEGRRVYLRLELEPEDPENP